MRKREFIKKFSLLIKIMIIFGNLLPKSILKINLKIIRNWDSYIAILIRYIILKNLCKICGDNVSVFSGVYIFNPENLEIGDNVSIHPMCYIDAAGGIIIGNNVSIAHATTVMSAEHKYNILEKNIKDQGCEYKQTIIKSNVWIGAGCRVLAGTIVNEGVILAAGAVVKGEMIEYSVYGGVPAKLIKGR